ncbi:hypothetical protein [Spirulina subsalsa]|uniref:hypothetical protein n=1 Tax=Spirulina subsalsa TaxID=54311 RepID=UPI00037A012C|nr:hypothetical protein [Spirulina subsalsa]
MSSEKGGEITTVTGLTVVLEGCAGEVLVLYGIPELYIFPLTLLFCGTTIIIAWINQEDPISLFIRNFGGIVEGLIKLLIFLIKTVVVLIVLLVLLLTVVGLIYS